MKALKICFTHKVRRSPPYLRCSGWRPSCFPCLQLLQGKLHFFYCEIVVNNVIISLDREVRVGVFLQTSATSELKWDWVHWVRTNVNINEEPVTREGWLDGVLKRFGLCTHCYARARSVNSYLPGFTIDIWDVSYIYGFTKPPSDVSANLACHEHESGGGHEHKSGGGHEHKSGGGHDQI